MRYLCMVYHEGTKLDALSQGEYEVLTSEVLDYHEALRKSGHYITSEALQPVQTATTIRVWNGRVFVGDGPLAKTKEQLGGFYLINARDLNDAIRVASKMPQAHAGPIVVWPILECNQD